MAAGITWSLLCSFHLWSERAVEKTAPQCDLVCLPDIVPQDAIRLVQEFSVYLSWDRLLRVLQATLAEPLNGFGSCSGLPLFPKIDTNFDGWALGLAGWWRIGSPQPKVRRQFLLSNNDDLIRFADEGCRLILFTERFDSYQDDANAHLLRLHDALT